MKYDEIISEKNIEYGIIKGNKTVFYIKAGLDGGIYGYNNKYLNIAIRANKEYGYTVIVASNPNNTKEKIELDMMFITKYLKDVPIIYAFGYSNGGFMLSCDAYKYENIKRVLICNSPLMFNFHKVKDGVKSFNQESMTFVFGSEDQSYGYVPLLENIENNKIKIIKLDGINHLFKDHLNEFIELPFKYLFFML